MSASEAALSPLVFLSLFTNCVVVTSPCMKTYELETPVYSKTVKTQKYWTMCIIANPFDANGNPTSGYKKKQLDLARNFFAEEFPELSNQTDLSLNDNKYVQVILWKTFHNPTLDVQKRALAGLCLRCYVSHAIVKGCEIIASKTADKKLLQNLLPYALNDDGNTFIVVGSDAKTQLIVQDSGELQAIPKVGNFVSVEVISSYNPQLSNSRKSESLDNWCIRRIKQNKNLQTLLLEYGVWVPSNWSLLCREIPKSLEACLQDSEKPGNERHFIEVFHAVYRRDRRKSNSRTKCEEPTQEQLEEMMFLLQGKGITLSSERELIQKFQEIAEILRQDNHAIKTGKPQADSIDASNSLEEDNSSFSKLNQLGTENNDCENMEENELREVLNTLPAEALYSAISFRIPQRVESLKAKKASRDYAEKFVDGLQLYYHEINPLSLKEIAQQWDIHWSKARRIFQVGELISSVQSTSEEIFISKIKEQASQFFADTISCNPNNLKDIAEEVRGFLDKIAFQDARAEIVSPRNPYKRSLFAQILRKYMNHKTT